MTAKKKPRARESTTRLNGRDLPLRNHAERALSDYFTSLNGHRPAHLPGPLDVDLQQRRDPGRDAPGEGLTRGAVAVPRETGPFEQFAAGDHGVEGLVADEVVFAAIHLARPG